ncbi:MAG TPA: SIMPL domain-containing protein, partial [Thermohalobaculum sp.]|nr:SIMPL domain-containing protein [Thermohalobaculum sp.]
RTTRVIEEIRAAGVEPSDIQTANFSVYPVYEQGGPERIGEGPAIAGFRVSNEVVARVRDIDSIGQVMASVVDAGANRINSLSFGIEDDTGLRDEARRDAVENARHLAELYAGAAGVSLGDVLSISDAVQGPRPVDAPMMRMEMAQSDAVPIERGENTVTATVDMTWEIAPAE